MQKKWIPNSENIFGDFSSTPTYGIKKISDEEYDIGRFNVSGAKDGLNVHRFSDGSGLFAKYNNDRPVYPVVKVLPEGNVEILLGEKGDFYYHLYLDLATSTFVYSLKKSEGLADAIKYDGLTGELSFATIDDTGAIKDSKPINRTFIADRPIVGKHPLNLPLMPNFAKFEYRGDETYACNESSNNIYDPGIGCITWDDGVYCVGGWLDNYRDGWQIYQEAEEEDFFIFYGHKVETNGLYVRYLNGVIYIKIVDGPNFNDNSYMLTFNKGALSFSEINEQYRIDRCGSGVYFKDLNTIMFKYYKNDHEAEATTLETFSRFDKLDEEHKEIVTPRPTLSKYLEDVKGGRSEVVPPVAKPVEDKSDPEYKLMHLIGQDEVKKEFARIKAYILKNDLSNVYLNMFFVGGLGVGKSYVARLLTEVLYKYHAISRNAYNEVSAKTLYSNFTGDGDSRVKAAFDNAQGGVLLIDDVHYLGGINNSGIKEALNTLTSLMRENKKTVVILCDTKYNIDELYNSNLDVLEGKIRFRINFKELSKEELKEVILERLTEKGYSIEDEALRRLLEVTYLSKSYGNEINISQALHILEQIIVTQNVRTSGSDNKVIIVDDINTYVNENELGFLDALNGQSDARKKLDELVGLEKIKETVDDLIAYFAINRGKKVDFHMAFTGNPGTGKTEVARIIGKLLREEGILGTSKFFEVTRRDLVGEYIGQSAVKTRDIIDKAMGGVLYIDEAYSLAYGGEKDFGREVIAELLKAMEDRRGEFCVVLSGYTNEMKKLFDTNPGFYSRIKFNLEFADYTAEEMDKIARLFLSRDGYIMSEDNIKILVRLVMMEKELPNFANVRTLREHLSRLAIKHAGRVRKAKADALDDKEITLEDFTLAFGEEMIKKAQKELDDKKTPKANPETLKELYKNYKDVPFREYQDFVREIVIAIRTSGANSGESSGFIVSPDGYIVTCAHCVDKAETIDVRRRIYHNGKKIDIIYKADLVSIDTKADVAIIKIRRESEDEEFDYIALADKDTKLEPLHVIYELGYPFGWSRFDELTINEGKIASYQKGKGDEPDQINMDIQAHGGNSGSLILDGNTSKVIGILCGASLSYHGPVVEEINYSRPISYVWSLIEKEFTKKEGE